MKSPLQRIVDAIRDRKKTPGQYVAAGLAHQKAGRLVSAESSYHRALALEPHHVDALRLLGLVLHQRGDSPAAAELINRAIEVDPNNCAARMSLATVLQSLNRLDAAEDALRAAVRADSSSDSAQNALGIVLRQRGNPTAAGRAFLAALQLNPRNAEAQSNLGNIHNENGDLDQAEACYRAAVELSPTFSVFRMNLGIVLQQRGQLDAAEECYREVLARDPSNSHALNNLGAIYLRAGSLREAEDCLRRAVAVNVGLTEAHCGLAEVLAALGRFEEAKSCCEKALALRPGAPEALNMLALVFKHSDLGQAENYSRASIAAQPQCAAWHNTLGTILLARGDRVGAETCFRDALRLDPRCAPAKYNLANLLLLRGKYQEGFELYENRFDTFGHGMSRARKFESHLGGDRRWRGSETITQARVLVWTEQGFGDSLMMFRYLPLLKALGAARVIVVCEPELARVVRALVGVDQVVSHGDELSRHDFDLQIPIMSLPCAFRTRQDAVPAKVPYLLVPSPLVSVWGSRLLGVTKPKVGLAWAGSRTLEADSRRSVPLPTLTVLLDHPAIQCVSLQKHETAVGPFQSDPRMLDWMAECADFMDTAALVENLDLVISVDTAVAHLAGALAKPVWLLNRCESEWRWGLDTERSAWYPTMRIFRQHDVGDWSGVLQRVVDELQIFMEDRPVARFGSS